MMVTFFTFNSRLTTEKVTNLRPYLFHNMKNSQFLTFVGLLLVVLVSTVHSQAGYDEQLFNSVVLRGYRPYSGRLMGYLEPPRVTRQDYTPTPCRWKLCASLFRN
uniref:Uncharacterized protein n=1 Tax=Panagrellus redivivus TaxID=6233 RepID=A0A7E4WAI1_PANRE